MKKAVAVLFLFSVAQYFISCSSTKEIEVIPVEERFERAKALFNDEKYLDAIEEFKIITVQFQGSEYADDAQYYIAQCRFLREEYILAASEFDNLVRTMPSSPFASLSRYMTALSYYKLSPRSQLDQKYTRNALDEFQTFIEYSPKDTLVPDAEQKIRELTQKLAKKLFEGGQLYYRVEYYKAAIAYFDKVISEYRDSKYVDKAMLWKAKSFLQRKEYSKARTALNELLVKFPDTDLKQDIVELQKEIDESKDDPEPKDSSDLTIKNE